MIYWVEKTSGTIRRCRFDECGHDDVELVKSGLSLPEGIAFDTKGEMLYWANTDENIIQRCEPNDCHTTTETVVANAGEPLRLAIDPDAGFVYWSERSMFKINRCSIASVPCSTPTLVVQNDINSGVPYGIAIDSKSKMFYWSGSAKVMRCDVMDPQSLPCHPVDVVGPFEGLDSIIGIALDPKAGKVYWSLKTRIEECPMKPGQNLSDIQLVTENVDMVRGLAIDPDSSVLYMAEGITTGTASRIRTCNAASDVATCADTHVFISGCPSSGGCMNMPYDVALDWAPETMVPETLTLPAWATESASTIKMAKAKSLADAAIEAEKEAAKAKKEAAEKALKGFTNRSNESAAGNQSGVPNESPAEQETNNRTRDAGGP